MKAEPRSYSITRKILYILTALAVGLVAFVNISQSAELSVTLMWDANDPVPEGYRVFQRQEDQAYDYSVPVWTGPEVMCELTWDGPEIPAPLPATFGDLIWNDEKSTILIPWTQQASITEITYYWVARAFDGDLESTDSEEVFQKNEIENKTLKWEVFYSETSGGEYILLDTVLAEDGMMQVTKPLEIVQPGETKTVYFTIVTFGEDGQFSQNAAEASVEISRPAPPEPPSGIRVVVTVPVQ